MQSEQPRGRLTIPLIVVALLAALGAGYGIEYAATQPTTQQLNTSVSRLQSNLTAASSSIASLNFDKAQLQAQLNSTLAKVNSLTPQLASEQAQLTLTLSQLQGNQSQVEKLTSRLKLIQNITTKLDNDRILLGDLRSDLPAARQDAKTFWQGVKSDAVRVDPTLGTSVDLILKTIDNYYVNYVYPLNNATSYAQVSVILTSARLNGALDYLTNINTFHNDALLVVNTHIDQLITLVT